MDLYEHKGKDLFERAGIPLPERVVAATPQEAAAAAERLGGHVAVKVQVQMGGRGKGGGVVLVHSPEEAAREAARMLEQGFGGGIIPKDDIPKLEEAGIEKIFTPGASTGEIVEWLNERLSDHQAS